MATILPKKVVHLLFICIHFSFHFREATTAAVGEPAVAARASHEE